MEKDEKSYKVELSSMSTQSSASPMEYLKNLHKQLFQITPENVKK